MVKQGGASIKINIQEFRESGSGVPVGTAASARSFQALRAFNEANAFHTLVRQRPPTPSCRGPSPYCGENSEPDRCIKGEFDIQPRVREQPGLQADTQSPEIEVCFTPESGRSRGQLLEPVLDSEPTYTVTHPTSGTMVWYGFMRTSLRPIWSELV